MALTNTTRNQITELIGTRPSDCTPTMWDILGVLRGCTGAATVTGTWSYTEIAGLANCAPTTARKAIRELAERGYITVYDTAHANRYRLSAGDTAAAEQTINRLTQGRETKPLPPTDSTTDAADRLALPGRPKHTGRRQTIRPKHTGCRLITEHDTPRGKVFRLIPARAQQSAKALQAILADDRGEIRVDALTPTRSQQETDPYQPRHRQEDTRPRWQRLIAPVGLGVIIAASLAMLGVTAANTAAAEAAIPAPSTQPIYPTWKTTNPGVDEPTENRSRTTNDDMAARLPSPDGEATPQGSVAEREAHTLTDNGDGGGTVGDTATTASTLPHVILENTPQPGAATPNPIEELAKESATTTITDTNGTVWEITADGTVLGALQGGTAGRQVNAPTTSTPTNPEPVGECQDGWTTTTDVNDTTLYRNTDGQECAPPSNPDGEAPQGDEQGETVPEHQEDSSGPF